MLVLGRICFERAEDKHCTVAIAINITFLAFGNIPVESIEDILGDGLLGNQAPVPSHRRQRHWRSLELGCKGIEVVARLSEHRLEFERGGDLAAWEWVLPELIHTLRGVPAFGAIAHVDYRFPLSDGEQLVVGRRCLVSRGSRRPESAVQEI